MKRIRVFFLGLFFMVIIGTSNSAVSEELKFTTQDFSPFNYLIDGRVSGPAAEIIRSVCAKISIDCSFHLLPWRRAQNEVKEGRANGMFVIGWNEKRSKWLYFTPPLLRTQYGFFVKDNSTMKYTEIDNIAGLKVGVFGPSNTSNSLEKLKEQLSEKGAKPITIDMRPDDEAGFRKLSIGRVDAVYSNRDVGFALLKKLNIRNVRYAGAQKHLKYYIGFSMEHTDKALVDKFNKAFREMHKQGTIQRMLGSFNMEPSELD